MVGDIDGAGRPAGQAGRGRRGEGRRGARRPRGRPGRGAGPQDRAGRGGREARRRVDRLEDRRRPAQGDPRRVEDHPRRRQEDRRRAVEAVRRRPGRASPAAAAPTSPPWTPQRKQAQTAQGGAGRRGRVAGRLDRLERHRQPAQGADDRVEGRAARLQGGRAEALGTVPGRPGRLLHPAQRGLLRPGRRAARATWSASRRCSPRPRRSTSTPTRRPPRPSCGRSRASGTTPAGCPARPPPAWTAGCARSRTRSATAMDSAWRRTDAGGQPAARPDARAGRRGRAAAGPGPGRRRRQADPRGRAGAGRQAAVPRARRAGELTGSARLRPSADCADVDEAGRRGLSVRAALRPVQAALTRAARTSGVAGCRQRSWRRRRSSAGRAARHGYAVPDRPRPRRRPGCGGAPPAAPSAFRWCGAA